MNMPLRTDDGIDTTRRQVLAAMGSATAVGIAGCAEGDDTSDTEFTAAVGANPGTMDPSIIAGAPANATVGTLAYEALLGLTFDLSEFRGELATDWTREDDTTLRFELREGVQFHNGDEFTGEDVRFSMERMRGTVNDATVSWIEEVEVVDDYEVVINAAQPRAPALNDLSGVPIVSSNVDGVSENPLEDVEGDEFSFEDESIGTGPFVLDTFETEDRVVLEPNENYWYDGDDYPGSPPWDTVTFRVVTEQPSQEESIQSGELDMIDNPSPWDLDQWDSETPEVISGDAVGFDFVSFPINQSPYTNEKFRRGITRLIPSSDVIENVFGGYATEIAGPISPGLVTFWDEEHEQELLDEYVGEDTEAALQLLEEAFEEEDIERPFELSMITNENRTRQRWMEIIQQTLDDTEYFDAELDIQAFDDMVTFLTDPEGAAQSTDIVGIGWTGGSDPNGHVEQILHSDYHVPAGYNWNLYENEEVDSLIEAGQTAIDTDARVDVYHDLQEVTSQEVSSAFMWTSDEVVVVNPESVDDLNSWQPHPNPSFRYKTLYAPHLDQAVLPPQ